VQAFINSLIGWVVFKFLTQADVGYLDVTTPFDNQVLCISNWPLRYEGSSWIEQDAWKAWSEIFWDQKRFVKEHRCIVPGESDIPGGCAKVRFPALDLANNLGLPIGEKISASGDVITAGATWFLYLGICLWFTTTVHDLALTSIHNHNSILDVIGIRRFFPVLTMFTVWMLGFKPFKMMLQSGKALKILAWIMLPIFIVWGIVAFSFVWWPLVAIVYLLHPISLSRVAVFTNAILFVLYGLALTIGGITFIAKPELRPSYAVTWATDVLRDGEPCSCGCVYHISAGASISFTLIGASVVWKAFIIGFRCLKGLRRSNWANLLTVMFPVPLNIYPVEWRQPDGHPIQHRTEEDPVQGELAFDPFALMDEQPESAGTILVLRPEIIKEEAVRVSQEVSGPVARRATEKEQLVVKIGCCGFPYRDHEELESEEPREEEQDATGKTQV